MDLPDRQFLTRSLDLHLQFLQCKEQSMMFYMARPQSYLSMWPNVPM